MPKPISRMGLLGRFDDEPLDVDPLAGFAAAFAEADAAHPLPSKKPLAPPPLPPEPEADPEIQIEGPPSIRPERAAFVPEEPAAPPGRMALNRMVPMAGARPEPEAPPATRSPLRPAAGGELARMLAELEPAAARPRRDATADLLGAQRHDRLISDANSVGDALAAAFTRTKAAPAQGTDMAGEFGARRTLSEQEQDTDPASERSRSLQALVNELLPGAIRPEDLPKLSKAQLKEMLPFMGGLEKSRAQRQAAIDKAAADRKNKLTDLDAARENKLTDTESMRDYQYDRDQRNYTEAEKRARIMAGAKNAVADEKRSTDEKEKYLEGFDLDPKSSPKDIEVQQARAAQASTRTIQQTAREIADLYRKHGTQALPTAERAQMQSLVTDLQLAMKGPEMFQLGVLAGPDMAILDRMVPDVTGAQANVLDFFGGAQVIPKLDALQRQVGRKFENKARALGYRKRASGDGSASRGRVSRKDPKTGETRYWDPAQGAWVKE